MNYTSPSLYFLQWSLRWFLTYFFHAQWFIWIFSFSFEQQHLKHIATILNFSQMDSPWNSTFLLSLPCHFKSSTNPGANDHDWNKELQADDFAFFVAPAPSVDTPPLSYTFLHWPQIIQLQTMQASSHQADTKNFIQCSNTTAKTIWLCILLSSLLQSLFLFISTTRLSSLQSFPCYPVLITTTFIIFIQSLSTTNFSSYSTLLLLLFWWSYSVCFSLLIFCQEETLKNFNYSIYECSLHIHEE